MSAAEPRGALGAGAAGAAPTAPHATPHADGGRGRRRSGPERFWAKGPVRVALAVGFAASLVGHSLLLPIGAPSGFEVKDVEGEAAIPIDLIEQPPEPTSPPAAPAPELPPAPNEDDKGAAGALANARPDAGPSVGGDASDRPGPDGASTVQADASALRDAAIAPGPARSALDAGGVSADDAASGEPVDPHVVMGAVAAVQPKVINVVLVINADVIRRHPVGATLGTLLRGIPQWDDFMSGTSIDPVRDTDWFMVSGPSLVNTERDVVLIHYSAPDAAIDRAVAIISHKYSRGGPVDLGVPGVKAVLAHADRADRIILRPQSHVLAVVPPSDAANVARQLAGTRVRAPILPTEAVYLRLVNPRRPLPELPDAITELRLRVVPRASDQGADVLIEGDTQDAGSAASAAEAVTRMVRRHNDMITALVTHGLLDHVDVTADGNLVKLHLSANLDQIQTLATLVETVLGVPPPAEGPGREPEPSRLPPIPPRPPLPSLPPLPSGRRSGSPAAPPKSGSP